VLHGVGWPGDVKRVALRIDKLKALGFKPSMGSREAVRATAKKLVEEFVHNGLAGRASPARQVIATPSGLRKATRNELDAERRRRRFTRNDEVNFTYHKQNASKGS